VSIKEHIVCLENLSALDAEIRQLEEQLAQDREALAATKSELSKLEEKIAADATSIAEMGRTRGELAQEARQMTAQVERSREKLSRARNEREQNAASRELEELRRLQKDREEEIGKLAMLEAAAQKGKEEAETERSRLLEQLSSSEESTTGKLVEIERQRDAKADERKRLATKIPRNVLSRYETIRKRKGIAIAQTDNSTCMACRMAIPPQLFQRVLRDEGLELCPHCQRILYYKAPPQKDAT
jgi:predicted  nucleic acid-binding Zn-ribbon protein